MNILLVINGYCCRVDYFRHPSNKQNSQIQRKKEALGMEKIVEIGHVKVKGK